MGMYETTRHMNGIHLRNPQEILRENREFAKQVLEDLLPFVNDGEVQASLNLKPEVYRELRDTDPAAAVSSIAVLVGTNMNEQAYLAHVALVKAHQVRMLTQQSAMEKWGNWERRMRDYTNMLLQMVIG